MITQTFDLNLIPNSAPVIIHIDQYDVGDGRLIATLYNGNVAYTPSAEATAYIQGMKPDGHGFMYEATISGNTVTADVTKQMTACAGRVRTQFVISESDNRTGTFVFEMDVQKSALPADSDMSTSAYQIVEDLLDRAEEINANTPRIGANGNWWIWSSEAQDYIDTGVDASITINIGTVTTLPAGSSATVTNSGTATDPVFNFGIPRGEKGERGASGSGLPSGGSVGQMLYKASTDDYDLEWGDEPDGLPAGGTQGQVLTKNSSTDGDADWADPAPGGVGKDLTGQTVEPTQGTTVTAGTNAEIFNDYRTRTFSGTTVSTGNVASGNYSHAEGNRTTASGNYSHAEGNRTTASGYISHAEGDATTASNDYAHAEGDATTASGYISHAEGDETTASGYYSHAEGYKTIAGAGYVVYAPHAEGYQTTASGNYSHAEGYKTIAGEQSSHAEGIGTTTAYQCQHAQGKYNRIMRSADAMIIGNGSSESSLSNCFRVSFAGAVYGLSAYNSSGADYAEFFEWLDGNENNEDRVGYFVTTDGNKIKIANENDYILGIVSGQPSIVGNGDEDWLGRWVRDDFGRFLYDDVEIEDPETHEKTTSKTIRPNPEYDSTKEYVERKDRQEWDYVGMLGALAVRDDGTCEVNGFCKCTVGGIATKADAGYRVIQRISENVIKVIFR